MKKNLKKNPVKHGLVKYGPVKYEIEIERIIRVRKVPSRSAKIQQLMKEFNTPSKASRLLQNIRKAV